MQTRAALPPHFVGLGRLEDWEDRPPARSDGLELWPPISPCSWPLALPLLQDGSGYTLPPAAEAYLGPGRPLGFMFDAQGHLVFADSLKVRCPHALHACMLDCAQRTGS